jgi:transposase-like protein
MAKSVLSDARFHNEEAAFAYVEAELWPNGPVCPHCENADSAKIGRLEEVRSKPSKKNPEGVVRVGLRKCYVCREQFTVRKGTIFEDSGLPLRLWLQAIHLLCSSKKGISTRQLQRMLGCGMKTAWHLSHRIRHAMAPGATALLGGAGKVVEADETELARSRKTKRPANFRRKTHNPIVMSLVERGGDIRSQTLDHRTAVGLVREHVHPDSTLARLGANFQSWDQN